MSLHANVSDHHVGAAQRTLSTAVGDDPKPFGTRRLRQTNGTLVLRAGHQQAAGDHAARELDENLLELLAGMVPIQVIGLDVGDDLDRRGVVQERAVRLVGLGDEHVPATQVRAGTQLGQHAAHGNRRVQPAGRQAHREHARRRRLPVRAGDADKAHSRRRKSKSLRAVNDPLATLARNRQLRIVLADRSRDHNHGARIHVRGLVPDEGANAHRTQVLEDGGLLAVRAFDRGAPRSQKLRDDAHARAADTDQMETILQRRLTHCRPPSPAQEPDPPAHGRLRRGPATARPRPCPPGGSSPAEGTRCGAQSQP